jgi:NAD(P)-dependent dehydrogenase (short-subunit alcohol dehydrogenase family)
LKNIFDMSGEKVLVTGASSGLGEHFAPLLAAAGASVVLASRRVEKLETVAKKIRDAGGQAETVALDVTSTKSVHEAVEKSWECLGSITVLINNAGVAIPEPALKVTEDHWDRVLDTNLKGCWLMAQRCAQKWVELKQQGNVVNIASIAGLQSGGQLAAYGASKAALISLTKSLSLEWARHDIRVNALAPGYVLTNMNRAFFSSRPGEAMKKRVPQRRIGELSDLNGPLLLLASAASGYMTGSVVVVDGGHLQGGL